jgi:hypothetical protein
MKTILAPLLVLILIFEMACLLVACRKTNASPSLEQSIADLCSSDFHTLRKAQSQIVSHGQSALPSLLQIVHSSDNTQQVALCSYLVGTIDNESYKKALLEFAVPGKICTVLSYPNTDAIKSLSAAQKQELKSHFEQMSPTVTNDEVVCLKKLIQSLKKP